MELENKLSEFKTLVEKQTHSRMILRLLESAEERIISKENAIKLVDWFEHNVNYDGTRK